MWPLRSYFCVDKCLHGAKEGDREGYGERVREREGKRERDESERKIYRERYTQFEGESMNGPIGEGLG